jgi:hypothetical protein
MNAQNTNSTTSCCIHKVTGRVASGQRNVAILEEKACIASALRKCGGQVGQPCSTRNELLKSRAELATLLFGVVCAVISRG